MNSGFDKFKRVLVFFMGVAILLTSIYFSVEGFDFKTDGSLKWVGVVLALAVTSAQFMFNTRSKDLNWTIVVLGIVAYGYSIWSNIMGFYSLRGTADKFDWMNMSGGIFMDVFPETAIAWSLGVIKSGDLVGNLVNVFSNPEKVTAEIPNGERRSEQPRKVHPQHETRLPKRNFVPEPMVIPDDIPDFLRKNLEDSPWQTGMRRNGNNKTNRL